MPTKIPHGYKQLNVTLPKDTVNKLDEICRLENRKRPGQVQKLIDEYKLKGK